MQEEEVEDGEKRTRDCRRSLIDNSNTLILLTDLGMLFFGRNVADE